MAVVCASAQTFAEEQVQTNEAPKVNVIGPFLWAQADGSGDVQFTDGEHLQPATNSLDHIVFFSGAGMSRCNLTAGDPRFACAVQLRSLRLFNHGAHNAKIMPGYMPTAWRFTHGDRNDLVHWAKAPRVVLYLPIRHEMGADADKPENYSFSQYGGQAPCVIEFNPGEHIEYEWFKPGNLHPAIVFDLYPYLKDLKPAVERPIFRFEVSGKGAWRVAIETDGRDGLAGGKVDGDYDMVFTQESSVAKPYTVDLGTENAFGMTMYNPTAETETSLTCLRLLPFDRNTGQAKSLPARPRRFWNVPLDKAVSFTIDPPVVWKAPITNMKGLLQQKGVRISRSDAASGTNAPAGQGR